MKQPKKPTREQKKIISSAGLKWQNWAVVSESDSLLIIQSKNSSQMRKIRK